MDDHAWGQHRILSFMNDGRKLYAAQSDTSIAFPYPRFISCWVSEVCNLDCTYCFFSETNYDKSHTFIDTAAFLSWLAEMRRHGSESLEFSGGGEPTLHRELPHIIREAGKMGYHMGMITHGCNSMVPQFMAENLKYVRVGLDAATVETHDAIKRNKKKGYFFPRAIENIKALVACRDSRPSLGFSVGIKVVLNAINYHELGDMIDLAKELAVDYIQIKREHSSDNDLSEQQVASAEERLLDASRLGDRTSVKGTMRHARATVKCFMSPIHTVVTATGKILQCCFFEDRPIGTILEPIEEVWGRERHRQVMEATTVKECDTVDCRWNVYNLKMKSVIEDPLASISFI